MTTLMLVVLAVFIMARVRDLKTLGGRACGLCNRHGTHAPWCPARGGDLG